MVRGYSLVEATENPKYQLITSGIVWAFDFSQFVATGASYGNAR